MQIKNLDELEMKLNEIAFGLDKVQSLSSVLLDCFRGGDNLKPQDIENLITVLNEKITVLKDKFNLIEQELNF